MLRHFSLFFKSFLLPFRDKRRNQQETNQNVSMFQIRLDESIKNPRFYNLRDHTVRYAFQGFSDFAQWVSVERGKKTFQPRKI